MSVCFALINARGKEREGKRDRRYRFSVSQSAASYTSISSSGGSPLQIQYYSRRSSIHSNTEPQEVADANVKFVRDTSRIWYKPNISREQGNFQSSTRSYCYYPVFSISPNYPKYYFYRQMKR